MIGPALLLGWFEILGVGVFAISGALAAGRKRLDLIGVLVVAIVTALGGGTLRDLLLGRHPIFWIAAPGTLGVVLAGVVFTLVLTRFRPPPLTALLVADALGLALFTVNGARIAEASTDSWPVIVSMGAITGVAGGVLRDVLCNEIPLVMRSGHLYATAAVAGAVVYRLLATHGVTAAVAAAVGMVVVAGVRLAAIAFGLKLPVYALDEAREG